MTTDTKELLTYAAKSGDKNAAIREQGDSHGHR